jgi:hypothetical protein
MAKKPTKASSYSKKQPVKDIPNPNRGGKLRPLIDSHGKNVRRGK